VLPNIMTTPQDAHPQSSTPLPSGAMQERAGESEGIEQLAFNLLVRSASKLDAELNRVLRPLELTSATYNILKVLRLAGGAGRSCGDISEQLTAQVPDMTRLLDRLERLGYVSRERSSIDRRMVKVLITDRGTEVLDSLKGAVGDCHIRQLGHLGVEKLGILSELLRVVVDRSVSRPRSAPRLRGERRGH
jgi:DNA-binding MarR family transcriptional regulator